MHIKGKLIKIVSLVFLGVVCLGLVFEGLLAAFKYNCHGEQENNYLEAVRGASQERRPCIPPGVSVKNRRKVLVAGSDVVYGLGVEPEQTFCWKLNLMQDEFLFCNHGMHRTGSGCALLDLNNLLQKKDHFDIVLYAASSDDLGMEQYMSMVLDDDNSETAAKVRRAKRVCVDVPIDINGGMHKLSLLFAEHLWSLETNLRVVSFMHDLCTDKSVVSYTSGLSNSVDARYRYGMRSLQSLCATHQIPFGVVELEGFPSACAVQSDDFQMQKDPEARFVAPPLAHFVSEPFSASDHTPFIPIIQATYPQNIFSFPELHTEASADDPEENMPSALVHSYYAMKIWSGLQAVLADNKNSASFWNVSKRNVPVGEKQLAEKKSGR